MYSTDTTLSNLEIEFGSAILSSLCGQELSINQQPVRLFDQTRHSAEIYYKADGQGKPYIQDFQNGKRYYPVTAYTHFYGLDFTTAKTKLIQQYYGEVTFERRKPIQKRITVTPSIDYLSSEQYQQCQIKFECNGLYEYLRFTYGLEKARWAFTRYHLGTSLRWRFLGYLATCLPQFDVAGNLRQVKVIPFDAMSGRRVKKYQPAELWNGQTKQYKPTDTNSDKIYFAGKQLAKRVGIKEPNLKQCFFGEHLLPEHPGLSVAMVEGESTAIVCSILWPEFIWLATGGGMGGSWYSPDRFSVLQGRNVTLWPDTGKYDEWSRKAESLRPLVKTLNVTDYVEKNAPVGMGNVDLRDMLTRPCYFPANRSQPIYGEVLTTELTDDYPREWDNN